MGGKWAIRHNGDNLSSNLGRRFRQEPRDIIRNRKVNRGQYGLLLGGSGQDPAAGAVPIVFAAITRMRSDLEAWHPPIAQRKGQTAQENAEHEASDHVQINISIPQSIPDVPESSQMTDRSGMAALRIKRSWLRAAPSPPPTATTPTAWT